jgi:hypothetical protein
MKLLRISIGVGFACLALLLAVAPAAAENTCDEGWTFSQSLELDPYFWSLGSHVYQFHAVNSAGDTYTAPVWFDVTDFAELFKSQVYLRFLRLNSENGAVTEIQPAQDTVFQFTWLMGPDRQVAEAFRDSASTWVSWDDGEWILLKNGPLTKQCAFNNEGHYPRSWGPSFE